ncbi:hypothetical protein J7438_15395 [Thalassotalea sp. G20_0]|uniref:hypothetical protein n=1 Tax=Thalassotalea sp. G20_0 TaxID=2821093 RepID=UPI001ADB8294|nr:hypothetical protein [Thalassotalea sp. G20_0]MBO9495463.1 hypothetical protein [Thalassotalea sp. G20_0]
MLTTTASPTISQPEIATSANSSEVPASPANWLRPVLDCAYGTVSALHKITRKIVSAPAQTFIFLALANRCITPVNASPHSPSSATPATMGLGPSVNVPSAPPYLPPPPEPGWMATLTSGHPAYRDDERPRTADRRGSPARNGQPVMDRGTPPRPENRCVEKNLFPFYSGPRISLACPGKILPLDQSRNVRHEYLQCGRAGYSWTRYPDPLDEAAWHALKETDPERAVQWLRDLPAPEYKGILDYPIDLVWRWEKCQLIEDPVICGTYRVCDQETPTGQNRRQSDTRNCWDVARSCYADVAQVGRSPCGMGKLVYDVKFVKIDSPDLSPGRPGVITRLANGYDLLPGEKEQLSVSIFCPANGDDLIRGEEGQLSVSNLRSSSVRLKATLNINDPKNAYQIHTRNNNLWKPASLQCRPNGFDNVSFEVLTDRRIPSSPPNTLRFPDGDMSSALVWGGAFDLNGGYQSRGYPCGLIVEDTASYTFKDLSLSTMSAETSPLIRVQLYESSWLGERLKSTAYFDDHIQLLVDPVPDNGASDTLRVSTRYQLSFDYGTGAAIYRTYLPGLIYYPGRLLFSPETLSYEDYLAPDSRYTFKVTMNLKNMPFYFQPCASEPAAPDCQWYALWGLFSPGRYESRSFSLKSLDITVTTPPQVELRSWQPTFWEFVRYAQFIAPLYGACKVVMAGH